MLPQAAADTSAWQGRPTHKQATGSANPLIHAPHVPAGLQPRPEQHASCVKPSSRGWDDFTEPDRDDFHTSRRSGSVQRQPFTQCNGRSPFGTSASGQTPVEQWCGSQQQRLPTTEGRASGTTHGPPKGGARGALAASAGGSAFDSLASTAAAEQHGGSGTQHPSQTRPSSQQEGRELLAVNVSAASAAPGHASASHSRPFNSLSDAALAEAAAAKPRAQAQSQAQQGLENNRNRRLSQPDGALPLAVPGANPLSDRQPSQLQARRWQQWESEDDNLHQRQPQAHRQPVAFGAKYAENTGRSEQAQCNTTQPAAEAISQQQQKQAQRARSLPNSLLKAPAAVAPATGDKPVQAPAATPAVAPGASEATDPAVGPGPSSQRQQQQQMQRRLPRAAPSGGAQWAALKPVSSQPRQVQASQHMPPLPAPAPAPAPTDGQRAVGAAAPPPLDPRPSHSRDFPSGSQDLQISASDVEVQRRRSGSLGCGSIGTPEVGWNACDVAAGPASPRAASRAGKATLGLREGSGRLDDLLVPSGGQSSGRSQGLLQRLRSGASDSSAPGRCNSDFSRQTPQVGLEGATPNAGRSLASGGLPTVGFSPAQASPVARFLAAGVDLDVLSQPVRQAGPRTGQANISQQGRPGAAEWARVSGGGGRCSSRGREADKPAGKTKAGAGKRPPFQQDADDLWEIDAAPKPAKKAAAKRKNGEGAAAKDSASGKAAGDAKPASKRSKGAGLATADPMGQLSERLEFTGQVKDASDPAVSRELHKLAGSSMAVVLSLLYMTCEAGLTMYHSATQALTKPQQLALRKARHQAAKASGSKDSMLPQSPVPAGVAVLVVTPGNSSVLGRAYQLPLAKAGKATDGLPDAGPVFYIPVSTAAEVQASQAALQVVLRVLSMSTSVPCICCDAKALLKELTLFGLTLPANSATRLVDPCLLTWMHEPDLACFDEKETSPYSLEVVLGRQGMAELVGYEAPASRAAVPAGLKPEQHTGLLLPPLVRLHKGLIATIVAFETITAQLRWLHPNAISVETQVTGILARMEALGIAFHAGAVSIHRERAEHRLQELRTEAARLVGHEFNLASAAQLAQVLYEELKLPVPVSMSRGGAKKLHHPTDEAALKQLAHRHALPDMVLEHRMLMNFISKYCDPVWVQEAADQAHALGQDWARVRCNWNQVQTATGRLSSSAPNLQAVTKYQVAVTLAAPTPARQRAPETRGPRAPVGGGDDHAAAADGGQPRQEMVNIRSAFIAPSGCRLLSCDYSQIELRILAHMSGDRQLIQLLRQAGVQGDAFTLIASAFLNRPRGEPISKEDREKAKRVTYGIIYGLSAHGLAAQLKDQGVDVAAAGKLIKQFMATFSGIQPFMERCAQLARREGYVQTLLGRRRPLPGINDGDHGVRAEAERKAINSTIQGSAADLIKVAMINWTLAAEGRDWGVPASPDPSVPRPVDLIAQIHDELLFECDERLVTTACSCIRQVMEKAWVLEVPLIVRICVGPTWGVMAEHSK